MTDDLNALADRCDEVAAGLTEPQRSLLLEWPGGHVTFQRDEKPHATADDLISLGAATIMPWKNGLQIGLTPFGLALRSRAQQEGQR